MKRIVTFAAAACLLIALAACGTGGAGQSASASSGAYAGMANPWSDVKTAGEAAEGAGVGEFELPAENFETSGGPVNWEAFRWMKGIAQANGYVGAAELTVRKGLKQDGADVSGDYTEYAYKWTLELDGTAVSCFGNAEGQVMKAVWLTDNFSYCFLVRGQGDLRDTYGLDAEATVALVSGIR